MHLVWVKWSLFHGTFDAVSFGMRSDQMNNWASGNSARQKTAQESAGQGKWSIAKLSCLIFRFQVLSDAVSEGKLLYVFS